MARKLKVYETQIGFHDLVVAAPSQAAALRAWGIHLSLFADGSARVSTDERAIAAALAQPEIALKRGVGTDDPFSLNPGLPRIPDEPKASKPAIAAKRRPTPSKPAPPDRKALSAAEAVLTRVIEEQRAEQAAYERQHAAMAAEQEDLRRRQSALAAEEAASKRHQDAARSRAEKSLQRERQAFIEAGGKP